MATELKDESKDWEETYQKHGIVQKGISPLVKQATKKSRNRAKINSTFSWVRHNFC